MNPIRNLSDLAAALKTAACVSFRRDPFKPREWTLDVFHDDHAADRRTIHQIRSRSNSIRYEIRTLKGWNAAKNHWSEYTGGAREGEFSTRQGEKALFAGLEKIRADHNERHDWRNECRNPRHFTAYPSTPQPS